MSILTKFYLPALVVPVAWGESLRFDYPTIGDEAMEIYEINALGVRTLTPLDSYYILYSGAIGVQTAISGGNVIFTRPYLDDTVEISIERNTPIYQLADFKQFGEMHMNVIEFVMDKITMIMQEIAYRKCNVSDGETGTTIEIDQLVDFYAYGPFRATTLDFVINKATGLAAEIKAEKTDCSEDLENT
jgi:hypothetical protein